MTTRIDPDSTGFLISTAARLMRAAFMREIELAEIGVTAGEARVLAHMSASDALRQSRLADRLGLAAMTVTTFLDSLEESGRIRRSPDPTDRRAKIVTLTAAAGPILEQIGTAGQRAYDIAFDGIGAQDCEVFRSVCLRLRENLERSNNASGVSL